MMDNGSFQCYSLIYTIDLIGIRMSNTIDNINLHKIVIMMNSGSFQCYSLIYTVDLTGFPMSKTLNLLIFSTKIELQWNAIESRCRYANGGGSAGSKVTCYTDTTAKKKKLGSATTTMSGCRTQFTNKQTSHVILAIWYYHMIITWRFHALSFSFIKKILDSYFFLSWK